MRAAITSLPNIFMAYRAIKQRDNVTFLVIIVVVVVIIIVVVVMSTEELGSVPVP
jgi:t-SNARE complex subunit (syntaxin)